MLLTAPVVVVTSPAANCTPSGRNRVAGDLLTDRLEKPPANACPAIPSNTTSAILPGVVIDTDTPLPPMVARPVWPTSATAAPSGGTKKSSVLCVAPLGVTRDRRPEVAPLGTGTDSVVLVAELT